MKADIYLFELQIYNSHALICFRRVWFKVMYLITIMIDEAKIYQTKT